MENFNDFVVQESPSGLQAEINVYQTFFQRLKIDFDAGYLGWVGDFKDFALGYLTFASTILAHAPRSHARPVGAVVIGETSTGKTELSNSLMKLFPENHVICVTSISAKGLIYRCLENPYCLNGKVVFVEELSGLRNEDLQYLLRILVTRGEVRHATVINGKPVEIYAKGQISLQTTGLPSDRLRDDTMNRLVTIQSDASSQMTAKVIDQIKQRYTGISNDNESDILTWYQKFFRNLQSHRVVIPFASELPLAGIDPESRRMAKITLDLLCTVTLINQADRRFDEVLGAFISEKEDFEILKAYLPLMQDKHTPDLTVRETAVLQSIQKIPNSEKFTYEDLIALKPGTEIGVEGGYSMTSIKYAVKRLIQNGNVVELGKKQRVRYFGSKNINKSAFHLP